MVIFRLFLWGIDLLIRPANFIKILSRPNPYRG